VTVGAVVGRHVVTVGGGEVAVRAGGDPLGEVLDREAIGRDVYYPPIVRGDDVYLEGCGLWHLRISASGQIERVGDPPTSCAGPRWLLGFTEDGLMITTDYYRGTIEVRDPDREAPSDIVAAEARVGQWAHSAAAGGGAIYIVDGDAGVSVYRLVRPSAR
jgi:hypothetical protein